MENKTKSIYFVWKTPLSRKLGGIEKYQYNLINIFEELNFKSKHLYWDEYDVKHELNKKVEYKKLESEKKIFHLINEMKNEVIIFHQPFYTVVSHLKKTAFKNNRIIFIDHSSTSKFFKQMFHFEKKVFINQFFIKRNRAKLKLSEFVTFTENNVLKQNLKNFKKTHIVHSFSESHLYEKEYQDDNKVLTITRYAKMKKIAKMVSFLNKNEIHSTFAGSGKEEKKIRGTYVKNVGYANEWMKNDLLKKHNWFIMFSSRYEGNPFTIVEALHHGVPVILKTNKYFYAGNWLVDDSRGIVGKTNKQILKKLNTTTPDQWKEKSKNAHLFANEFLIFSDFKTKWIKIIKDE